MDRVLVCYENLNTKTIEVDALIDFKQIRMTEGIDRIVKIEEKLCQSKKQEIEFEKRCKKLYTPFIR